MRLTWVHASAPCLKTFPDPASLVTQWQRLRLPMQKTRAPSLIREAPTCLGATKPVNHSY